MFEFEISISILGILTMHDPTKGEPAETGWGTGVETGRGAGVETFIDYLSSV